MEMNVRGWDMPPSVLQLGGGGETTLLGKRCVQSVLPVSPQWPRGVGVVLGSYFGLQL